MNEKIIDMVRRSPGVKTGQIADQLDVSFEEAQNLLAQLVHEGVLKGGLVALAGGGKVMSFELTDKGTKLTPPLAFRKPPVEPRPAIADLQPTSKINRAILHIEKHGPTVSHELRGVMDLPEGASVANYLAPAVKNGRVHHDDGLWKLGAAKKKAPENVEVVGNVILATRDASPVPEEVKTAVMDMAARAVDELTSSAPDMKPMQSNPAPPARHRCAIWSDGVFEVETDGVRAASLNMDQAEALMGFIERMGGARVVA